MATDDDFPLAAVVTTASMEGRAIARPNTTTGGHDWRDVLLLQWRAGQLPGQTRLRGDMTGGTCSYFNGGPGNCPAKPLDIAVGPHAPGASMEGRAIARPNRRI